MIYVGEIIITYKKSVEQFIKTSGMYEAMHEDIIQKLHCINEACWSYFAGLGLMVRSWAACTEAKFLKDVVVFNQRVYEGHFN